jgi:uncharacterized peroxidase-related enzyme
MDLRSETNDPALVQSIVDDYTTAPIDAPTRALLDYAVKLTQSPHDISREDIEGLRTHGFSDEAIHDAAQVIAFFNYINRIADGLGVDLEQGMPKTI